MIKWVKVILKENFHMLANKYVKDLLWTHLLNISVLELSEQASVLNIMCHFSLRQSLHFLVTGLKTLPLSIIFHGRV